MVRFAWMPYSNQMSDGDCFVPFTTIAFWNGAENWDKKQSLSIQRVIISCNYLIFFSIDFLKK